jgi:plastocyanin
MNTARRLSGWLVVLGLIALGCGSSGGNPDSGTPGDSGSSGLTIHIVGYSYQPLDLTVDPGAVITVVNDDSMPHTLTSEANFGDFRAGAVAGVSFDTGNLATGETTTFTIPASAITGTVIPYFCVLHGSRMAEGSITVR